MPSVIIRSFQPDDTNDLYDICLRTGNAGADATALMLAPQLLGEVFVGPYLAFAPELALVADDGRSAAGYAIGTLDTTQFEQWCALQWWPRVQAHYVDPAAGPTDLLPLDDEIATLLHHPDLVAHPNLPGYPSHLHIDLLNHVRGVGTGRQMMEQLFALLSAGGSTGVHLGVALANERAQNFYARLGFHELLQRGDEVFLGLRFA